MARPFRAKIDLTKLYQNRKDQTVGPSDFCTFGLVFVVVFFLSFFASNWSNCYIIFQIALRVAGRHTLDSIGIAGMTCSQVK